MKIFEKFFMFISGFSLIIVFLTAFIQVVQRYIFNMSIPWATDIIKIFFIYSVFSGMCVGLIQKKHLDIDIVVQLVSPMIRKILSCVSNLIVLIFLSAVLRYSITFILENRDQTTPYLLFPMSYIYVIFPITISVMILALVLDLYKTLFTAKEISV